MTKLSHIFEQNKLWADGVAKSDPTFFERLAAIQRPKYMWIGCSDSRVPANQILGLMPGEVFVHRNVGNIVGNTDLNCLSVLQYAVDVLEVDHVIVCGHYGCGAVQAAWEDRRFGLIDSWLGSIRETASRNSEILNSLSNEVLKLETLSELNVIKQATNVCRTTIVQDAWRRDRKLTVHAWIYRLTDGRLQDLSFCVSSLSELQKIGTSSRKNF